MTPAPTRRWFRFSLRTLFVVVMVFGVMAGWNVYEVQQRRQIRDYIVTQRGLLTSGTPKQPWKRIPIMWRWLGEESFVTIELYTDTMTEDDRSHIAPWFPEAVISLSGRQVYATPPP